MLRLLRTKHDRIRGMQSTYGSCFLTGTQKLFMMLDKSVLKKIENTSRVYTFSRKDRHFEEFSIEGKVYIIHEGKMFLSYIDPDGKKIILDVLNQGDIFGDLDFNDENRSIHESLFIEPFTDSSVCEMNKKDFREILLANPKFAVSLLSKVSNRLSSLENKVGTLIFSDVEARLIAQMVHLSQDHGKENENKIWVGVRITHEKLAEMIGAARETVSEAISNLKKRKVLSQDKKRIFILNKNKVKDIF